MEIQKISETELKKLSQIGDRKYHERYGEFLAEGIRFVAEAFRANADVREIAVTLGNEKNGAIKEIIEKADAKGIPVYTVFPNEMERISRTENNQGIAAGIALPKKPVGDIFGEFLQIRSGIILLLDGLQDPGNVGTLIRTSEAFGVAGIILGKESAGIYNPKTLRGSMGAVFRVPIAEMHDRPTEELIPYFKKNGFQIASADAGEKSIPLPQVQFHEKVLLILGQEAKGSAESVLDLCDVCVAIPMTGPTESLNAAIAGGILIYEITARGK
jgi:TrmH family RNA methyltransferase